MSDVQLPRRRAGDPPPPWRCTECGHDTLQSGVRFVRIPLELAAEAVEDVEEIGPGGPRFVRIPLTEDEAYVRSSLRAVDRCAGCGREYGRPATPAEWERHRGEEKPSHQRLPPAEKEERAQVRRELRAIEREQERGWETDREESEEAAEMGALPHLPGWLGWVLAGGALALGWLGWRLSRHAEPRGSDASGEPRESGWLGTDGRWHQPEEEQEGERP